MTLVDYVHVHFASDIRRLKTERCHLIARRMMGYDGNAGMFGGPSWQHMEEDLSQVSDDRKPFFCLSLFTMTCTDQNIHAHFRSYHRRFREMNPFPKFGWCGFSPQFEKPRYLLERPVAAGVDFSVITDEQLDAFIREQIRIAPMFLGTIESRSFFSDMVNDRDFRADVEVFGRLNRAMENIILPN